MDYFDYKRVADEAGIPPDKLDQLAAAIRAEFPRDDMMYELHVLRACRAIKDGYVSIDDAIQMERAETAS